MNMRKIFESYTKLVLRHRVATIVSVVVITVGLGWAATWLHVEVDPDKQGPQGHPYIEALNDLYRTFGDKNLVVVGLFPRDGRVFTPAFLSKIDEVTRRLSRVPGANPSLIRSLASPEVKDIRAADGGIEVRPVMGTVPSTQEEAEAVRERISGNDDFVGTLVSYDGTAAVVQASFELTPATPDYQALHQAIRKELDSAVDDSFDYRLSGLVIFLSELSALSGRMVFLFPIALLVIALMHYDAFRTAQGLMLPIVTAVLAVIWSVGLMGLFGISLDPLNTTTPILILAVAAGHAVQVLKRFYEEYERIGEVEPAIVSCLGRIGPVMVGAGLVATFAFWSLTTFATPSIRIFGAFAGLGVVSALIIELTIIPSVRAIIPMSDALELVAAQPHRLFDPLIAFAISVTRRPRLALLIAGVVFCASAIMATRTHVDTSLRGKFRPTDRIRVDDQAINDEFAGTSTLILLIEGAEEGSLDEPSVVEAIARLQERLLQEAAVNSAYSYVSVLQRMHEAMAGSASGLPESRALVEQYLFLHSLSGGADSLDSIIDPTHRIAKIRYLVNEDSSALGERLIAVAQAEVRKSFPEGYTVRYSGTLASTVAATEVMVEGKVQNILQVAVLTAVIAGILLRSALGGLLVCIPLAMAVSITLGTMAAVGIPLDTLTAAIAAMAVGIGADYAMYLLFRVREEAARNVGLEDAVAVALETSGKAVLFVASAIAAGYSTLALSGFSVHVHLGLLVALSMAVSALSTLFILPSILLRWRPGFICHTFAAPMARPSEKAPVVVGDRHALRGVGS